MNQFKTVSEEETQQFAIENAEKFSNNSNIVLLKGLLGAGKTTFVKGLATAFGANLNEIKSPTYTYMRTYQGLSKKIVHLDLYRLDDLNISLLEELQEYIEDENNLIVIEWPETIEDYLPANRSEVMIEHGDEHNHRTLNVKYAN